MKKILAVYGTATNPTPELLKQALRPFEEEYEIEIAPFADFNFQQVDLVVFGVPTHYGALPGDLAQAWDLVRSHEAYFARQRLVILGVGDQRYGDFCGAAKQLANFVGRVDALVMYDVCGPGYPQMQGIQERIRMSLNES